MNTQLNEDPYIPLLGEFHQTFLAPILDQPTIPAPDRCQLRVSLLAEELDELRDAIVAGDPVAVLDALCDLQYVLTGAVLEFGMGDCFRQAVQAVHHSNMSKACLTKEEVTDTLEFYRQEGVEVDPVVTGNKTVILRKADQKVMKNRHYQPVDLRTFVVLNSTL